MRKRPAGAGSSSGSGVARSAARPRLEPRRELLGHVVGGGQGGEREPHVVAAAGERDLRHHQVGRREPRPVRRGSAVVGEREAADRHEAGAGRPVGRVGLRRARQLAPRGGDLLEAPRPAALEALCTQPSAASAAPPRSGCSKQNHGSPARREAKATALGSTLGASGTVTAASTSRPLRRARRTARSQRARRPRSSSRPRVVSAALTPCSASQQRGERHAARSRQRSSTRPDGERSTELTDSVPLTPLGVKWPSTLTR